MPVALNGENRPKDVANDNCASLASISTGKFGMICAELENHTEIQVVTDEGCEGSNHYDFLTDDLGVGMTDPDGLKLYWRPWLSSKKTANVGAKTPGAGKRGRKPRVLDLGHFLVTFKLDC